MRIAVVGSGIAGLSAAWLLSKHHEVVLFEADDRPGGHANTVDVPRMDGQGSIAVDTGFIVFNRATYPNLCALFDRLDVPVVPSDMSFAVSMDDGALEYSAGSLFAQRLNLLNPRYLLMLRDILRFFREAPGVLTDARSADESLGAWLTRHRYGRAFIGDHLVPMGAAIWSAPLSTMLDFPVRSFVRFFANHGLLLVRDRPPWFTISGGSRTYVRKLIADGQVQLRLSTPVLRIERTPMAVSLTTPAGTERFDHAVLACHPDQGLAMLAEPSAAEAKVLGAIRYQANQAVLHRDARLMPKRRRAWASWNVLADRRGMRVNADGGSEKPVTVSYWMNLLQPIDRSEPLFVTLNAPALPDPDLTLGTFEYAHPLFDGPAISAQSQLADIQGVLRTWFCGAWCGYGFHEDGLASGLAVAEALGGNRRPWTVDEISNAGAQATPRSTIAVAA